MTQQAPEQEIPEAVYTALTYLALDELSDQAWIVLAGVWLARASFESDGEWIDAIVDALVEVILESEEIGHVSATEAEPVSEPLVPEISEEHVWKPIKDFDADAAQEALEPRRPIEPEALRERITDVVVTIIRDNEPDEVQHPDVETREPEPAPPRFERLVRNEVIQAAVDGQARAMTERDDITGWRRQVEPDCCAICFYLWKEGYVYRVGQPMWRHTGCRCSQVPTRDKPGRTPWTELGPEGIALLQRYYEGQIPNTRYSKPQQEAS